MAPRHTSPTPNGGTALPHLPARKGRPGGDQRLFLDAILGSWIIVYQRFSAWQAKGCFDAIFKALQVLYLEEVMTSPPPGL